MYATWESLLPATGLDWQVLKDASRPGTNEQREFVARALESYPALRVVVDRAVPGASAVVTSPEEVRAAVLGRSRPGGPVGSRRPGGSDG